MARLGQGREEVSKAWLIDIISAAPLAEAERLPMPWIAREMPALVDEILAALGANAGTPLRPAGQARVTRLAELRATFGPARTAREIAALQGAVLATLRKELAASEPLLFADAAQRLAEVFAEISGTVATTSVGIIETGQDPSTGLDAGPRMQRRLKQLLAQSKRYGEPFSVVMLGVEAPGTRQNGKEDDSLEIVAAALQETIRVVDDAFIVEADELCVLAPNQTAVDGIAIAERLAATLAKVDDSLGLGIGVSAGVVASPEHGDDPERLLTLADTAMWRARATGRPVAIGSVQDLSQDP